MWQYISLTVNAGFISEEEKLRLLLCGAQARWSDSKLVVRGLGVAAKVAAVGV
jgi:hypothetical protein